MKKVFLLIICLMLLTGCSASIKSEVLNNGRVIETVNITQNISNLYLGDQVPQEYLNETLSVYSDTLDEEGYKYSSSVTNSEIIVTLTKEFSDICSYFNNSLFVKTSSSNLSCVNKDGNYKIEGDISYFICGDDCMEPPSIDNATLTIDLNKEPISSNANTVNKNSYTWNFDSSSDTKLELTVKNNDPILNSMVKSVSPITWVIVGLVIVCIFVLIGFILYKKYKSNRIDY